MITNRTTTQRSSSCFSEGDTFIGDPDTIDHVTSKKRIDHVLSVPFNSSFQLGKFADEKNKARGRALVALCNDRGYFTCMSQAMAFPLDAFFAGIDVKKEHSLIAPEIRLAAWLSLGQYHAEQLGFTVEIPRVAISVVGHHWNVYVACAVQGGKKLLCVGPMDIGSTQSEEGIFRIVHVLRRIVKWGNTEFREMFQEGFIDKLAV